MDLFEHSVKSRDSIAIKLLYVKYLIIWVATNRTKYVNITLDTIEELYSKLSFTDLMSFRTNMGVILQIKQR